eukprot:scaffold446601_cov20-Prasinocladus_malaysianus.AAC.1
MENFTSTSAPSKRMPVLIHWPAFLRCINRTSDASWKAPEGLLFSDCKKIRVQCKLKRSGKPSNFNSMVHNTNTKTP